jgi:hypothetical protein
MERDRPRGFFACIDLQHRRKIMEAVIVSTPVLAAAAGYSLVYLLAGGGFLGAVVIFFVAKMLGA